MSTASLVEDIVAAWSDLNPTAGYTGGHLTRLTTVFEQSAENLEAMRRRLRALEARLPELGQQAERTVAAAVLTSLRTQIDLSRPSGAGPSGTGMGGVYAAADGIFYIVLKQDFDKDWSLDYLHVVAEQVEFETLRWAGQDFTILVRKECLNTAVYMRGTLAAYLNARKGDEAAKQRVLAVQTALAKYEALFKVDGLDSDDFNTYWPVFRAWDEASGPTAARGYPACLKGYYQLEESAEDIERVAMAWMQSDFPVTAALAVQIAQLPFMGGKLGSLGQVWDRITEHYAVDFTDTRLKQIAQVTRDYGRQYIIHVTDQDRVDFAATPEYLVNVVTGGEDFAVNYLRPVDVYSQLYLTASKNTSLLTMINILVHEASHGYNFVLAAKSSQKLLNLNTALEVPMTEGQAFYREFQYWAAAQDLLGKGQLNDVQRAYLELYGKTAEEQATAVLCAQFETYVWRLIRYVRALCDVRVNGGKMTYTDFIAWASKLTGLSMETLHGECFTFMASPGYAPCYAVGGAGYAVLQKQKLLAGVSELEFNTLASSMGFSTWPLDLAKMAAFRSGKNAP